MSLEKINELNQIKEDIFALYPNATKITLVFEDDKVTVSPVEKYVINLGDGASEE